MKKGLFIGFTAFLALFGASFANAQAKTETKAAAVDQKEAVKDTAKDPVKDEIVLTGEAKTLVSTIDKLADLVDRAKITLNRFATKGYDTVDAAKLLQNAENTLTIAHDGLVAKDAKNQITLKKAQELVKIAKQSLIDSLITLKTSTDIKNN